MKSGGTAALVVFRRPPGKLGMPRILRFARQLRDRVARGSFHCILTGDAELRSLNRQFLGKDYITDVLSFPSGEREPIGEIAISIARARAQARERGHSLEDEICILLLHGVLHLNGMDHETDNGRMARSERRWRKEFGLPDGLIERAASHTAA